MKKKEKTGFFSKLKNTFKGTTLSQSLLDKCNVAIDKEIAVEFRDEAKEIIALCSEEEQIEFSTCHETGSGNVCGLILDRAKRKLVIDGKLVSKENDAFGKPFML